MVLPFAAEPCADPEHGEEHAEEDEHAEVQKDVHVRTVDEVVGLLDLGHVRPGTVADPLDVVAEQVDAVLLDAHIGVVDAVRQEVVGLLGNARDGELEQKGDVRTEQFRQQRPSPLDDLPEDRDRHDFVGEAVERRAPFLDAADEFHRNEERVDHEAEAGVGQQVEEQVEPLEQRDGGRLHGFLPRPEQ